ncbi:MAG: phosphoribosylformylglycinamidine synthase subunit PurL [SAR202 cluster bacterium]|nr:phosphoribosylformylglycinamidine synthase subunit PurL [SAR202 cluster bacterium]
MPASKAELDELALTEAEYEAIVERLGREPNHLELGLFGSLWSEHCGYKHSKPLLKLLPAEGRRLLVKPGAENAGVVEIAEGMAVAMKIESHNHPSAIEPVQGAATGVGGIVRDILAMGARPIALLNSLRFGPLTEPRNRFLFHGVVGGISSYGNCIGVPDVGGEIVFSKCYSGNPLVNAMCVGLLDPKRLARAVTGEPGNLLLLVGADTGRDGIHGASGLASRTFEEERELRPTVQVGNPFLEKVLIEACLELAQTDYFVGLQDLGAAGMTSASVESAHRSIRGIEIEVADVPRRDTGLTPYEVMLSESQERMLVVVKPGFLVKARAIFEKWDLQCTVVGRVTDDATVRILESGKEQGRVPVGLLVDPPMYRLTGVKPKWMETAQKRDLTKVPLPKLAPGEVLRKLLASPNIASRESVYRQYDHQVQTNTLVAPGQGDAAVLRLKGTDKAIAVCTDGNGRLCYLDPFVGGAIAVAEACRNVSCTGAEPIALTDGLNMGNPDKLDVYYQLEECIKGIAEASRALNAPVISGNVSLYNETQGKAIYPTPIIGALGVLEHAEKHVAMAFRDEGDVVLLLGAAGVKGDAADLAGSEYLELVHGLVAGQPRLDLKLEAAVQRACRMGIAKGLVKSAHDCSDGGLAVAIAESCIVGRKGFKGEATPTGRWDTALFGEAQSRIVVSVAAKSVAAMEALARAESAPICVLGQVYGVRLRLGPLDVALAEATAAWRGGLASALAAGTQPSA